MVCRKENNMSRFIPGDTVLFIGDEAARMHRNSPNYCGNCGARMDGQVLEFYNPELAYGEL